MFPRFEGFTGQHEPVGAFDAFKLPCPASALPISYDDLSAGKVHKRLFFAKPDPAGEAIFQLFATWRKSATDIGIHSPW